VRLAVVADIHANRPALEAVLADLPPVDGLVCAGDIVGYGPHPAACVRRLRGWADDGDRSLIAVQGNHDRAVAAGATLNGMAGAGVDHARRELDADALAWLDELPAVRTAFDGRVRVAHGHPADPDRYVYPALFEPSLLAGERALVLGHTHVQAHERYERAGWTGPERRVVLNPGSVGQPRDGDPRAAYALLDLDPAGTDPTVTERRVDYDIDATVAAARAAGLPAAVGARLRKGK
jgi:diadenosine tetraphosphatase ApaH/serine/threonine PP2A family protein phosphatase